MSHQNWHARNKRELIIEVWEYLDCESVGAGELERIQDEVREMFGDGAVDSPAAIARVLVDEGATLRHPEVVKFDVNWRQSQTAQLTLVGAFDFSDLSAAAEILITSAERWREVTPDEQIRLRELVKAWRQEVELVATSKVADKKARMIAEEIGEWIGVWLQSPEIFEDWLILRRRAPDFTTKFVE